LSPKTPCFDPGGRRACLASVFPTSRSPEDTKVKIVEEAKAVRLMPPASASIDARFAESLGGAQAGV
jgi:hypothetical protein